RNATRAGRHARPRGRRRRARGCPGRPPADAERLVAATRSGHPAGRGRHDCGDVVIRGVLFDLDGTLIDTATAERGRWTAVRGLIERRLPEVDVDDFERRYRDHTRANRATSVDTGHFTYLDYQRQRLRTVLEPWGEPSDDLIDEYARTSNEMMALVRPLPGA